jgi:hypothetical protein
LAASPSATTPTPRSRCRCGGTRSTRSSACVGASLCHDCNSGRWTAVAAAELQELRLNGLAGKGVYSAQAGGERMTSISSGWSEGWTTRPRRSMRSGQRYSTATASTTTSKSCAQLSISLMRLTGRCGSRIGSLRALRGRWREGGREARLLRHQQCKTRQRRDPQGRSMHPHQQAGQPVRRKLQRLLRLFTKRSAAGKIAGPKCRQNYSGCVGYCY